jgi:delta 1-pyrroline-5-carboxylate dehydrogenase
VKARLVRTDEDVAAALIEGEPDTLRQALAELARRPGAIVLAQGCANDGALPYNPDWLVEEVAISTNIAAVGGDAALMAIA